MPRSTSPSLMDMDYALKRRGIDFERPIRSQALAGQLSTSTVSSVSIEYDDDDCVIVEVIKLDRSKQQQTQPPNSGFNADERLSPEVNAPETVNNEEANRRNNENEIAVDQQAPQLSSELRRIGRRDTSSSRMRRESYCEIVPPDVDSAKRRSVEADQNFYQGEGPTATSSNNRTARRNISGDGTRREWELTSQKSWSEVQVISGTNKSHIPLNDVEKVPPDINTSTSSRKRNLSKGDENNACNNTSPSSNKRSREATESWERVIEETEITMTNVTSDQVTGEERNIGDRGEHSENRMEPNVGVNLRKSRWETDAEFLERQRTVLEHHNLRRESHQYNSNSIAHNHGNNGMEMGHRGKNGVSDSEKTKDSEDSRGDESRQQMSGNRGRDPRREQGHSGGGNRRLSTEHDKQKEHGQTKGKEQLLYRPPGPGGRKRYHNNNHHRGSGNYYDRSRDRNHHNYGHVAYRYKGQRQERNSYPYHEHCDRSSERINRHVSPSTRYDKRKSNHNDRTSDTTATSSTSTSTTDVNANAIPSTSNQASRTRTHQENIQLSTQSTQFQTDKSVNQDEQSRRTTAINLQQPREFQRPSQREETPHQRQSSCGSGSTKSSQPCPSFTSAGQSSSNGSNRKKTVLEILDLIKICRICDMTFLTRAEGKLHLRTKHNSKLCSVCYEALPIKGVEHKTHFIKEHVNDNADEKAQCPVCNDLHTYEGMYHHIAKKHLGSFDPQNSTRKENEKKEKEPFKKQNQSSGSSRFHIGSQNQWPKYPQGGGSHQNKSGSNPRFRNAPGFGYVNNVNSRPPFRKVVDDSVQQSELSPESSLQTKNANSEELRLAHCSTDLRSFKIPKKSRK